MASNENWLRNQLDKLKNDYKDWPDWLLKSSGINAELNSPWDRVSQELKIDSLGVATNSIMSKDSINGNIMCIIDDNVSAELYTAKRVINVQFPKSIFPDNLYIGMPFSLSIRHQMPVIKERELTDHEKARKKDLSLLIDKLKE